MKTSKQDENRMGQYFTCRYTVRLRWMSENLELSSDEWLRLYKRCGVGESRKIIFRRNNVFDYGDVLSGALIGVVYGVRNWREGGGSSLHTFCGISARSHALRVVYASYGYSKKVRKFREHFSGPEGRRYRHGVRDEVNFDKDDEGVLMDIIVDRIFSIISDTSRLIFKRHFWDNETFESIGNSLGVTKQAIHQRLNNDIKTIFSYKNWNQQELRAIQHFFPTYRISDEQC